MSSLPPTVRPRRGRVRRPGGCLTPTARGERGRECRGRMLQWRRAGSTPRGVVTMAAHPADRGQTGNPAGATGLADRKCVPCQGGTPPLTRAQFAPLLAQLDGWQVENDRMLVKVFRF